MLAKRIVCLRNKMLRKAGGLICSIIFYPPVEDLFFKKFRGEALVEWFGFESLLDQPPERVITSIKQTDLMPFFGKISSESSTSYVGIREFGFTNYISVGNSFHLSPRRKRIGCALWKRPLYSQSKKLSTFPFDGIGCLLMKCGVIERAGGFHSPIRYSQVSVTQAPYDDNRRLRLDGSTPLTQLRNYDDRCNNPQTQARLITQLTPTPAPHGISATPQPLPRPDRQ